MENKFRTALRVVLACLLLAAGVNGAPGARQAAPEKVPRLESNLSVGRVSTKRIGAVKSIWWHAVPRVIAIGLSFDWVSEGIPFSLAVAVNAPIPVATPFVCAGAGFAMDGCSINFYGGGLKVRLFRKFGLIAEYRNYRYTTVESIFPVRRGKGSADYFGGGIAWFY
ncbi:MAG: hypothetical protein JW775_11000 [Candidatus Aminicenantes bacterium]|nr:hypothetical protein [Candidatus Aminicenantes bacterium]